MCSQEFSAPPPEGTLAGRGISPLGLDAVKRIHETDFRAVQTITHGYDDKSYRDVRTSKKLLARGEDYAELPGYRGQTARALLEGLSPGAAVLDIGCATGSFGHELVTTINQGIRVFGYDARSMEGQTDNLSGIVVGNIYDLAPRHFPETRFDAVMSSAVIYHLGDPLNGIMRAAAMVRDEGLLLLSTVPRVINTQNTQWTEKDGSFIPTDNINYRYYGGRNYYDADGRLIPSRQLAALLGQWLGFDMEYAAASVENSGGMTFGGQLSGRKKGSPNESITFLYCQTNEDRLINIWRNTLGYIVAKTPEETQSLQRQGYVEVKKT